MGFKDTINYSGKVTRKLPFAGGMKFVTEINFTSS